MEPLVVAAVNLVLVPGVIVLAGEEKVLARRPYVLRVVLIVAPIALAALILPQ
jgi:hypothetical protein